MDIEKKVMYFNKRVLDLIILLVDCDQDKNLTYEQIAYKILETLGIKSEVLISSIKDEEE